MKQLLVGGGLGLLLGMALQLCGLADPRENRALLAFRRARMARALVFALGLSAAVTAFLMWLAVIDTDEIPVAALSGSLLAGAVVCGAGLGLTGQCAETALAGIGGGPAVESLCAAMGCALGVVIFPYLAPVRAWLDSLFPAVEGTVFKVTLQRPYLFGGAFLGQGCLGLALMVLALFIRDAVPPEAVPEASHEPGPEEPPASIEPSDVHGETFVASLPGEEPVVVDTEADQPTEEPDREADEASAGERSELVQAGKSEGGEESAADAAPAAEDEEREEEAAMDEATEKETAWETGEDAAEDTGMAPPGDAMDLAPDPPGNPVDPVEQAAEALQPMNPVQQMMMPPEARIPPEKRMDSIRKGKKKKSGGKE